jgi:methionyl-tRNA synthetase
MPGSMARLLDQLGVPSDRRDFAHAGPKHAVPPGTSLPAPRGLFPRITTEELGIALTETATVKTS